METDYHVTSGHLLYSVHRFRDDVRHMIIYEDLDPAPVNPNMDALASQQVVHEFGFDRTLYVLANTIQLKDWDGRFSQDNKAWARSVQIAGGDEGIRDHRWKFVVDKSHSGLTDMFTAMVRHDQELDRKQRASILEMLKKQPQKNSPNNSANFSKGQER